MKKPLVIVLTFLVGSLFCFSQISNEKSNISIENLLDIPQESIFVHYNTGILFAGEQLLYNIYCFDDKSKRLSNISKIGYIELIAKDKSVVFKHKIRLASGIGHGDFSIPINVSTGSYKLFAYTQWMQNSGTESFFEADVAIINPYQKTPEDYLEKQKDKLPNIKYNQSNITEESIATEESFSQILSLDKTILGKRKKLTITVNHNDFIDGCFSLSVRKQNELFTYEQQNISNFFENYKNLQKKKRGNTNKPFFYPELRGELISGIIRDNENNQPLSGEKLALSFPGDNYIFKISTADDSGRFYFNFDTFYDNSYAILQQLSDDWNRTTITIDKNQIDYEGLRFKPFKLNSNMKEKIEERSVQNQIENAYINLKLDKKSNITEESTFYREFETTYDLDDYTRFNTIQETIIEVINQVSIKKTDDKGRIFQLNPKANVQNFGFPTLLFVDGVFIKEHEDFMDYSSKKIKTISFSKDKYLIGSLFFQGLLSITTLDGDFAETENEGSRKKMDLFEPEKNKIYFKQDYGADTNIKWDRIPDFRRQLLWVPSRKFEGAEVIELYTSDIAGDFKVYLQGFSSKGVPISVSKTFRVE